MTVSPKDSRLMLLISSIVIVIPMVIFPAKLGTELSSGSLSYALFEVLYYGVIFFILRPGSSIFQLFQGAGLTFLLRIVIGTVFGVMISIMYDVGLSAALSLGVSKYLPAIILHIAFAPIITKPFYYAILGEPSGDELHRDKKRQAFHQSQASQASQASQVSQVSTTSASSPKSATAPIAINGASQVFIKPKPNTPRPVTFEEPKATVTTNKNDDGFTRAVKYIGEHHSVKLAAVVDHEGLTMSTFSRNDIDVENWAPLALLLNQANADVLNRMTEFSGPDRLDLTFGNDKLYSLKISQFILLVLSDREDDDLLGIRLAQASDMVSKYLSERYDKLLSVSPEEQYVSST